MKHKLGNRFLKEHVLFKLLTIIFCGVLIHVVHVPIASAAPGINPQIPFYGFLRGDESVPVTGTVDMIFKIYDAPTGGSVLWEGNYTESNGAEITVVDGLFQVLLGSGPGNELEVRFDDDTYYLGITIEDDSEMVPRERLGAAGYAINSDFFDGMDSDFFIRNDRGGEVSSASSDTLLALNQAGSGDLFSVANNGLQAFTILNNGNVGVGTDNPSSKLTVEGDAAFSRLETFDDVLNVLAGSLAVQSGDRSSFGGDVYIADGSGIVLGGEEDGISISQNVSAYGENSIIFNLRGSAQDHNRVNFVSPGELHLVANADLEVPGDGGYPILSLDSVGGILLSNTSYGDAEDRQLTVDFTNGMLVSEGNLVVDNGNIGIGTDNPSARIDVDGLIRSTQLVGGGSITADVDGNIILDPSDRTLKQNIREIDDALEIILKLRGVRYEWKDADRFGTQTEIGFIAQELQPVLPEVVREGNEYLTVNIKNIVAVVVEAIQELHESVGEYFTRTERLESEVVQLRSELERLRQDISASDDLSQDGDNSTESTNDTDTENIEDNEEMAESEDSINPESIVDVQPETSAEEEVQSEEGKSKEVADSDEEALQ